MSFHYDSNKGKWGNFLEFVNENSMGLGMIVILLALVAMFSFSGPMLPRYDSSKHSTYNECMQIVLQQEGARTADVDQMCGKLLEYETKGNK